MVKCRGQDALNKGVTLDQSALDEAQFFRSTDPWRELDQELFGVANLRSKLSALQVHMIKESIPSIVGEIIERRDKVTARLDARGSLLSTPLERRNYCTQMVRSVTQSVGHAVSGQGHAVKNGKSTFLSGQNRHFKSFRDELLSQRLSDMDALKVGARVVVLTPECLEETCNMSEW